MARNLDLRLQQIINSANSNAYNVEAVYPSRFPEDVFRPSFSHHVSSRRPREETSFLQMALQPEAEKMNEFERRILDSSGGHKSGSYQGALPITVLNKPFIQHNPERKRFDAESYSGGLRIASHNRRQQYAQYALREPTAIFHGIERSSPILPVITEPEIPLNFTNCAYNGPGQGAQTAASTSEMSSPSNRISLRRRISRPQAVVDSKDRSPELDDETVPYVPLHSQAVNSSIQANVIRRAVSGPPIIQGIQLVSPHELPDKFRQVFPYKLFNAVQSKCFVPVYNTNDNLIVSAPTGSGKTAILELAICKLALNFDLGQFKIVYQAPTKSLCAERVRDWQKKFSHLNLSCAELTGDTDVSEMRKVGEASILVTTPEKWDSITRKWKDHIRLLQMIKLFLIDEAHILKDVRGATLEAVISRMKSVGSNVRFIALSATVPNSEDIATWLGKDHTNGHLPAHREVFGEEFRPVKLQKHVYGFTGPPNDFAFESILDAKLPALIAKHTTGKPIMVFCFTRKSCEKTAVKLAEWWAGLQISERAWPLPTSKVALGHQELRQLIGHGVAFHHAGLDIEDRTAIETGFINGGISVICCTSTLAVGINLPCHLVVIKNTVSFTDGGLGEYSDLEVMQMLGRAGRPQFGDSATAIIMTRSEKLDRYNKMISGQEILESTLHQNLIEHLNSEVALGTIHDVYSAKFWLAGTFLSVRMRRNPSYYKFNCDTGSRDADERLEQVCERDIELLQKTRLITNEQQFTCTEYGQAMSKYMVQYETMKLLLSIPQQAKMTQMLHILSQAVEFKDLRLKPTERACFRELNRSPFIKSPIKENITSYGHKVSLIIQIQLGGVEFPTDKDFNSIKRQFMSETGIVFDRMRRLIRCVIECKAYDSDAVGTCNAIELARSISAGFWEHSTLQLRQIPNIGPAALRKLVQADIKTVHQICNMEASAIERVLSRNPPYGRKVLDILSSFPRLTLKAQIVKKVLKQGSSVKVQIKALLGYTNSKIPTWLQKTLSLTFISTISTGKLVHIWRGPMRKLEKSFEVAFTCELKGPEDTVSCHLACEEIVGTMQSVILTPDIPPSAFPPAKEIFDLTPIRNSRKMARLTEQQLECLPTSGYRNSDVDASPGSDYGGDSVFEDFMDIDTIGKDSNVRDQDDEELVTTEPVRMANGKWQCNHKCRDRKTARTGQRCKHKCCREGLDKPRKVARRRIKMSDNEQNTEKNKLDNARPSGATKKTPYEVLEPKFKLAQHVATLDDVEELDLVDDLQSTNQIHKSGGVHPRRISSISDSDNVNSARTSKRLPRFSYTSGVQSDLSQLQPSDNEYGSDTDFPSPFALLGIEVEDNNEGLKVSRLWSAHSQDDISIGKLRDVGSETAEGMLDAPFELEYVDDASHIPTSPNVKRAMSPSLVEPESKSRRITDEEVVIAVPAQAQPIPEWAGELDPDIFAYFFG